MIQLGCGIQISLLLQDQSFQKDNMFSKFTFRLHKWIIIFVIPFLLFACNTEPKTSLPNGIPKEDIVFMPEGNPVNAKDDGKTLGFVNADGTEKVFYTFKIFGGARSNFGEQLSTQQANYPRWSRSGTMLAFSVRSTEPDIRLIDSQGRMYGQKCDALDQASTFDSKGNILGEITAHSSVYPEYQDKITAHTSLVARYDLKTCTIVDVFSIPVPQKSLLSNISEAENGLVTAEFYESNTDTNKVVIFNPKTQTADSFSGYYPSFSDNGTWLAYYDLAGNLVVRDIKSGTEKTIINAPTVFSGFDPDYVYLPGWSPDNQWLVYNTQKGGIYKVNIGTGKNVYITDGWAPDWRP
jgi:hypothetical protein